MNQVLVIAAALAIHASASDQWHPPLSPPERWGQPSGGLLVCIASFGPILIAWLLTDLVCRRAGLAMDRHGSARAAARADKASARFRSFACLWLGLSALGGGWVVTTAEALESLWLPSILARYASELAGIGLLAAAMAGSWWSFAPVESRIREAMLLRRLDEGQPIWEIPGRAAYTIARLRDSVLMVLIPVVLLLAMAGVLDWFARGIIVAARRGEPLTTWLPAWALDDDSPLRIANLLQVVGLIGALALMPVVQRRIWDTVQLGPGPLLDSITELCARSGTRLRRVLVWRTRGLSVNAAVLGALPRFRYLVFTDALLDSMSADQVRAVAAHEIGHLRHHHVTWLLAGMGAALTVAGEIGARVAAGAGLGDGGIQVAALASAVILGLPLLGSISRRFEWQADAHAARLLSAPSPIIDAEASRIVCSALAAAARLNGADPGAFSWRHGSIAHRLRRLSALAGRPAASLPVDSAARAIKIGIALAWVAILGLLIA